MAGQNGFHQYQVFYGLVIDINDVVISGIANKEMQDAVRKVDVLVKVGDKVREMTLPEFLEAVGFPNTIMGDD
jgi:hypothetical protein